MCARSEYFRHLFLSGMKEAVEDTTDLTPNGVSYDVFASLLEFIYTDALPSIIE